MLVTVTNLTANTLNALASTTFTISGSTASLNAVSDGARDRPLPFPFGHVVLGPNGGGSDAKQLGVRPRDFRNNLVLWRPHTPGEEWNVLVQNGTVSFVTAAETGRRDQEELFINAV